MSNGGNSARDRLTEVVLTPATRAASLMHPVRPSVARNTRVRAAVHTDAADTQRDEDAVCYLQLLLADDLPGFGRERAFADMDAWGYTFRLGSARAWFEGDAEDAAAHLAALPHLEGRLPAFPAAERRAA